MLSKKKISFIGAGKMAEAIISGIIRNKLFAPGNIFASDKDHQRLSHMVSKYRIKAAEDNVKAVIVSDVVVLSVKPQQKTAVLDQIKGSVETGQLFISIAAGIPLSLLEEKLSGCPVIRVMPNNPCMIGEGMSVISKGRNASDIDLKTTERIFASIGRTMILDEKHIDAATGLSGSGPAFVYRFMEALIEGGMKSGLDREIASELAKQTIMGAIKTVIETKVPASELCEMVASPGGTTVEGFKVLDEAKFNDIVADAVYAAAARAKQLSKEFGGK